MTESIRKPSQEVEIDHLLAEEFSCDPCFASAFLAACGLSFPDFKVVAAVPEPSLGGEGFGDLLIEGDADGRRIALLIEDKISAAPATRQAERYLRHSARMLEDGWDHVYCILVAPSAYRGERRRYDASVDLEKVFDLLSSPDPARLVYRRGIIKRALSKVAASGVQVPDLLLHKLKSEYLAFADQWCVTNGFALRFPALRESYHDGDSWIDPITFDGLPAHLHLRHRLWTSVRTPRGQVDLILSPADSEEKSQIYETRPNDFEITPYAKGKGIQLSLAVPEMRQSSGFDSVISLRAFESMKRLVEWYLGAVSTIVTRRETL